MPHIRRAETIALIDYVQLKNVCFPKIGFEHECYVKMPLDFLPQPCLVVIHRPNGTETWLDSLVITPEDAPRTHPKHDPVYAAAIDLMCRRYKDLIEWGAKEDHTGKVRLDFFAETKEDAPFVCAKHAAEGKQCWNPLVLRRGVLREQEKEDWFILESWKAWQAGKLTLRERARIFYAKFPYGMSAPTVPAKSDCVDADDFELRTQRIFQKIKYDKQKLDTFKKRVERLGLPSVLEKLTGKPASAHRVPHAERRRRNALKRESL